MSKAGDLMEHTHSTYEMNDLDRIQLLGTLVTVYLGSGQLSRVQAVRKQTLDLCEQVQHKTITPSTYQHLAELCLARCEVPEAIELLLEARRGCASLSDPIREV